VANDAAIARGDGDDDGDGNIDAKMTSGIPAHIGAKICDKLSTNVKSLIHIHTSPSPTASIRLSSSLCLRFALTKGSDFNCHSHRASKPRAVPHTAFASPLLPDVCMTYR
jgi:hypothetical protein